MLREGYPRPQQTPGHVTSLPGVLGMLGIDGYPAGAITPSISQQGITLSYESI
jgi:hypothetical protein